MADEWIVNGTKMWVTNGMRAQMVMLLARTPDDRITCFIVEKGTGTGVDGLTVSRTIPKLGYKGVETVEMSYVDFRVPDVNVLGGPDGVGHGWVMPFPPWSWAGSISPPGRSGWPKPPWRRP